LNIVNKARKFAERAHKTQARKYTGEPYFVHLDEVAKLCARYGLSKRAVAAAYLHDTIEDQPVTYEDLVNEFGADVANIVRELTDEPTVKGGPSRKERKLVDLDRLANASAEAQSIKCADMISNTSSIVRHDVHFARTYLPEKRAALTVMTRAKTSLLELAWERLIEAERTIANA
jgi:(p)ppGpp synthase/HD superfamily hydrolase